MLRAPIAGCQTRNTLALLNGKYCLPGITGHRTRASRKSPPTVRDERIFGPSLARNVCELRRNSFGVRIDSSGSGILELQANAVRSNSAPKCASRGPELR